VSGFSRAGRCRFAALGHGIERVRPSELACSSTVRPGSARICADIKPVLSSRLGHLTQRVQGPSSGLLQTVAPGCRPAPTIAPLRSALTTNSHPSLVPITAPAGSGYAVRRAHVEADQHALQPDALSGVGPGLGASTAADLGR